MNTTKLTLNLLQKVELTFRGCWLELTKLLGLLPSQASDRIGVYVALVISDTELAVTGGKEAGLQVGMCGILGEMEIFDPVTHKSLGMLESYTVKVREVHPLWARCVITGIGYNAIVSKGDRVIFRSAS